MTGTKPCTLSRETVEIVDSCPTTEEDVEQRKKIKNCEAHIQNCTTPQNFQYHCVMNEFESNLVEVCAPAYYINNGKKVLTFNDKLP